MNTSIQIFRYLAADDVFVLTDEYRSLADALGLSEWHPTVWIGRLFCLDNDVGEHWFDTDRGVYDYLTVNPDKFQDGRDGPCHPPEFRKRFWTDVLRSLRLDLELLFDKARMMNEELRQWLESEPDDPDVFEDFIPDLEDRIAEIRSRYAKDV